MVLTTTLAFNGFFDFSEGVGYTVGGDAVYMNEEFSLGGGTIATTRILTFINKDKTKASSTVDNWNSAFGEEYFLVSSTRSSFEKISEEEYIDGIQQEFDAQNIPACAISFCLSIIPKLDSIYSKFYSMTSFVLA